MIGTDEIRELRGHPWPWIDSEGRNDLLSLLMILYKIEGLLRILRDSEVTERDLELKATDFGRVLTNSERKQLSELLMEMLAEMTDLDILHGDQEHKTASPMLNALNLFYDRSQQEGYMAHDAFIELRTLRESIEHVLDNRAFIYIPSDKAVYIEHKGLFGDSVFRSFPEAQKDIEDAGSALALSLYTAAVFHLMRVTEHGLRRLAKRMQVKLTHGSKPLPLEFADWDKVITGIRNKIAAVRQTQRSQKRQAKLELYSSCADHCEYMKDIWRNNAAHTREAYRENQALDVMQQVRAFMGFLSANI